nr:AMP-binding protein [Rhodococcus wratislaviensis]GLK36431.1 long-chain acyl-CoA synthetase [Rhodococcus wratislaviensis]
MTVSIDILPDQLPRSLDYPSVTVPAVLAGAARAYGDRLALIHGEEQITYAQLWDTAKAFAFALAEHGVGRGATVALHLPNSIEFAAAYYGTLIAGATYSPTNPLLPPDDLAFQLNDCNASAVVTHDMSAQALDAVVAGTDVRLVVHVGTRPAPHSELFAAFVDTNGRLEPTADPAHLDDLAHISYTGGTTGRSKGVELTHRNVVANIVQFTAWNHGALPQVTADGALEFDQVGSESDWPVRLGSGTTINLTPWFHAMGCVGSLSVPFAAGVTLILHDRFNPANYLSDAEKFAVTSMSGAPTLFAALLASPDLVRRDLGSVRNISSGAGPLPHSHIRAIRNRFSRATITEGYGLTEATMGVAIGPTWVSGQGKPGTVGVPVFDTEIKLIDPETGADVELGARGEILVRGPQVMRGYHDRPQETAEVLTEGWLYTGDIGIVDSDGYLSIVDRSKDMLIYKGYNIYPREIEEMLLARPEVHGAAVVGRPDAAVGEVPVAFVVLAAGPDVDLDTLQREVNAGLLPYKRIKEMHVIDTLPVSGAGKILKRTLRERLAATAADGAEVVTR